MSAPNDRVAALVEIIGQEETRDLVRLFLRTAPDLLGTIRGPDPVAARRAAHSLKSSALQMGLPELSGLALSIEKTFDAGRAPSAEDLAALATRAALAEVALRPFAGPEPG